MNTAVTAPSRRLSPRTRTFRAYCRDIDQNTLTIAKAGAAWLKNLEERKRRPIRSSTSAVFRSYLNRIIPLIGDVPVVDFNNRNMRDFVAALSAENLSAKSISEIVAATKSIVASVTDLETGERIYRRDWNPEFIDAPEIESQHQPLVTASEIETAVAASDEPLKTLLVMLGATGLRVGEMTAMHIDPSQDRSYWDRANAALIVRTSVFRGREQTTVKTPSAIRTVEICQPVNELLANFVGDRAAGFIFGTDKAPHYSRLHSQLERVLKGRGFHSLRRYRATILRAARCPEDIIRFWMDHSGGSITDHYSKLGLDTGARREWCDTVGIGFELPEVIR